MLLMAVSEWRALEDESGVKKAFEKTGLWPMDFRFTDDVQDYISKSASVASESEEHKVQVLDPCLIRDIRAESMEGIPGREVEDLIRSLLE